MLGLLSQQPSGEVIMQKRFLIVASSALLLCFSCPISQAQTKIVSDDDKAPTYEVGGQIFSFG
jgi:hypothetical protein